VRSYDLIATKPCVIVADIAHLPLKSNTQDYAVFCLSLMGTNYIEFILEADRVLKSGGRLIIAEVESRCKYWDRFEAMIGYLGYECVGRSLSKYFRVLTFEKSHEPNNLTR
jgi:ribosomal RNA-processing protein 8